MLTHLNTYWAEALEILCHAVWFLNISPGARQKGYLLTSCLSPGHSTTREVCGPRTLRDWQRATLPIRIIVICEIKSKMFLFLI